MSGDYDFDYHEGKDLKLPRPPVKPVLNTRGASGDEALKWANALLDYEAEVRGYEVVREQFYETMSHRMNSFTELLREDYGLDSATFKIIWEEAYDRGHHAGLEEVYAHFQSLFSFLQRIKYAGVL